MNHDANASSVIYRRWCVVLTLVGVLAVMAGCIITGTKAVSNPLPPPLLLPPIESTLDEAVWMPIVKEIKSNPFSTGAVVAAAWLGEALRKRRAGRKGRI